MREELQLRLHNQNNRKSLCGWGGQEEGQLAD